MRLSGLLATGVIASITGLNLPMMPSKPKEATKRPADAEAWPDRVCVDKTSPFFDGRYKRMGVKFDGEDRDGDVQEFCVSEGWIRVRERNSQKRFIVQPDGSYKITKLFGVVEPYWKRTSPVAAKGPSVTVEHDSAGALARAEAKNKRKAERNAKIATRTK